MDIFTIKRYKIFFKILFLLSLLFFLGTFYFKDKLPQPYAFDPNILKPPLQTPTSRSPFVISANHIHYLLFPKFDYELTGVVVSYSNADGFTNIWHHKSWQDFINVRDICVLWEPNVSSGIYQKMQFSSDSWTCWTSWQDSNVTQLFQSTALSNNHLLSDNEQIKKTLMSAEIGDVIYLRGVLTAYRNEMTNALRGTSITREDRGNGACETIYVEEFKILKKANANIRQLYRWSKWLLLISFIGFFVFWYRSPHESRFN